MSFKYQFITSFDLDNFQEQDYSSTSKTIEEKYIQNIYSSLFSENINNSSDYNSFADDVFDLIKTTSPSSSSSQVKPEGSNKNLIESLIHQYLLTLETDTVEIGMKSKCEDLVRVWLDNYPLQTKEAINTLFLRNLKNEKVLISILHTISHLDYDSVYPQAQTIALACLSNKDVEIKEYGLRIFESWANEDSIESLEQQHLTPEWLDEYRQEIIEDIKGIVDVSTSP